MPERILDFGVRERYYDAPRPTEVITTARNLTSADMGKMLIYSGTTDITLSISNDPSWIQDAEIDILQISTGRISITASVGLTIIRAGDFTTHTLAGKGCAGFLKLISATNKQWYLAGNFY